MNELLQQNHRVDVSKTSARFACAQWSLASKDYHPSLFLLTMIIRLAFQSIKGLREYSSSNTWTIKINKQPLYKCVLFRKLYDKGHKKVDADGDLRGDKQTFN